MIQANAERALADLYELRRIGTYKTGVHRPTLSPEDMESREWLASKLREIGHEVTIDGIAPRMNASKIVLIAATASANTTVAESISPILGSILRNGMTTGFVTVIRKWPTGLRKSALTHCIQNRNRTA